MFGLFDKLFQFITDMFVDGTISNLTGMVSDVNEKVGSIAVDVAKTPQAWNPQIFNFIKNINNNVIIPIASLIITAVLCLELINMVMNKNNMHDTDTFDFFKYIFKMWVSIWLVTHAFDFSMAVFDVSQHLVNQAAGIIKAGNTTINADSLISLAEKLREGGVGGALGAYVETSLIKLSLMGVSIVIMLVLYGRMFEIYVTCATCVIPFSTFGNKDWSDIGKNFIKSLFSLGLQGLIIMISVGMYSTLISTMSMTDIHSSCLNILGFCAVLCIMLFKSGAMAKSILNAH